MSYLTLTLPSANFNFNHSITKYCFSYEPSWSFNELMNGQLAQKYDLGIAADKLYSNIEFALDFGTYQTFTAFIKATKGQSYFFSSDLDLFFPNFFTSGNCIITKLEDKGYLNNSILTGHRLFSMQLYAPSLFPNLDPSITYSMSLPTCFPRGIWTQNYSYSDKVNVVENGQSFEYNVWSNDTNSYTVSFPYLTFADAQAMMTWIATLRAQKIHIITSNLNLNKSLDVTIDPLSRDNDFRYMVKDFTFSNEGTYYTLDLTLNSEGRR